MPEMLEEFPEERIDWKAFTDGRPRLFTAEELAARPGDVESLRSTVHKQARYYGMKARTRSYLGGVAVEFYVPNQEES